MLINNKSRLPHTIEYYFNFFFKKENQMKNPHVFLPGKIKSSAQAERENLQMFLLCGPSM